MTDSRTARYASAILSCMLLLALAMLAGHAQEITGILAERIMLCLQTLIPSLFGCMAMADLLTASGAAQWLGKCLSPLGRLLRMPPDVFGIFLIAQLAGYPAGALLLRRAVSGGQLSDADAARLTPVCFGCGPAFAVGMTGGLLFGSAAVGWCMLLACVAANLLLALTVRVHAENMPAAMSRVQLRAADVTGAVSAAMKSLAQICGMVLLFGILLHMLDVLGCTALLVRLLQRTGLSGVTVRALIAVLCDITQLSGLCRCGLPLQILLPLTAGLLSFGGICVHWQCLALGTAGLSPLRLICMRLAAGCLSALIMRIMLPLIPIPDAAAVFSAHYVPTQTGSPLPALLIFCTGFPFLLKKD